MASSAIVPCPHCNQLNRIPEAKRDAGGRCGRCREPLFTGKPIDLDSSRFDVQVGSADLPVLVDFWAAWCGPCRSMAPAFATVAAEFEPRLRFAKLDTEAHPQIAARYKIQSLPTLVLFRGGHEVDRVSGALPAGEIRRWVNQHAMR